ncbi:hypothetical protein [Mycolicibacterium sp. 050158]|uniref:hypothetical protein n=1 Tax=Mycolicibacterium sp. 050158 TaxID=3090602 RepID=UPI00299E83C8|nr:hypothetical protein [Mycolicibacterium sp. 050158]MDX1888650.1 hypothetical protein [Mycolicibacterium sp. 050158]
MKFQSFSGVANARANAHANVDVMPWSLHVAGPVAPAAHWAIGTKRAIPALKRRAAAATVASVNRGSI